jgi:hypothetical protein
MWSVELTQNLVEHDNKIRKLIPHLGAHEKRGVGVGEAS